MVSCGGFCVRVCDWGSGAEVDVGRGWGLGRAGKVSSAGLVGKASYSSASSYSESPSSSMDSESEDKPPSSWNEWVWACEERMVPRPSVCIRC